MVDKKDPLYCNERNSLHEIASTSLSKCRNSKIKIKLSIINSIDNPKNDIVEDRYNTITSCNIQYNENETANVTLIARFIDHFCFFHTKKAYVMDKIIRITKMYDIPIRISTSTAKKIPPTIVSIMHKIGIEQRTSVKYVILTCSLRGSLSATSLPKLFLFSIE